jgi:hypothetical protein
MQMVRLDGRYAKAGIDAEIGTGLKGGKGIT